MLSLVSYPSSKKRMRASTKKGAHFAASGAQAEGSILGSLGDIPLGRACSATAGRTECIRDDGDDDTGNDSHPDAFRTCCGADARPGV